MNEIEQSERTEPSWPLGRDLVLKRASLAVELDDLFQARYRVFVEEKRYFAQRKDARLFDRFDTYPLCVNLIGLRLGRVVAGVRLNPLSGVGTPFDDLFDLSAHLPRPPARVSVASQFFVALPERGMRGLSRRLVGMTHTWARSLGFTHIASVASPDAERLLLAAGHQPIVPGFYDERSALHARPLIVHLPDVLDEWLVPLGSSSVKTCARRAPYLADDCPKLEGDR
jgi:N-acyl-L-homoserine lactone synthetase